MRALIRDFRTGMFYGTDGQWTAEREEARDFGGTYQAANFAVQGGLREVEVLLAFERPEYDVTIKIEPGRQPPGSYRKGMGNEV